MSAPLWHAEDGKVRLDLPRFQAAVVPAEPGQGIHDLAVDHGPFPASRLLRVFLPGAQTEAARHNSDQYVRGGDLVVTYPEQNGCRLKAQVYWRTKTHRTAGAVAAVELVTAVQTSTLDASPIVETRTDLVASEAFQLIDVERGVFASILPKPDHSEVHDEAGLPQCYLFRMPGGKYSYAEMVHPADAEISNWEGWLSGPDFRLQLEHRLFAGRLERGVILKARVLGVILERAGDRIAANDHYRAFLHEELPLTT